MKKSIVLLIFALIILLGCNFPTHWSFVNESEVNNLLKSIETLEFEGKEYKLNIYYKDAKYEGVDPGRGFPFTHSKLISKEQIEFSLHEKNSDNYDNSYLAKKLKATNLWVINKKYQYYFETSNLTLLDKGIYTLDPPLFYQSSYFLIVKFVSIDNKSYFIRKSEN